MVPDDVVKPEIPEKVETSLGGGAKICEGETVPLFQGMGTGELNREPWTSESIRAYWA